MIGRDQAAPFDGPVLTGLDGLLARPECAVELGMVNAGLMRSWRWSRLGPYCTFADCGLCQRLRTTSLTPASLAGSLPRPVCPILGSVSIDVWIGAVTTLAGTALGGGISSFVSRQQAKDAHLQRDEEYLREQRKQSA
jgi:hypothetical protein